MRLIKPPKNIGKPYKGANPILPTTADIVIPSGTFLDTDLTIWGDDFLVPKNIARQKSIFEIFGDFGEGLEIITPTKITETEMIATGLDLDYRFEPTSVLIRSLLQKENAMDNTIFEMYLTIDTDYIYYNATGFLSGQSTQFLNSYNTWSVGSDGETFTIGKGIILDEPLNNQPVFDVNGDYEIFAFYPKIF